MEPYRINQKLWFDGVLYTIFALSFYEEDNRFYYIKDEYGNGMWIHEHYLREKFTEEKGK